MPRRILQVLNPQVGKLNAVPLHIVKPQMILLHPFALPCAIHDKLNASCHPWGRAMDPDSYEVVIAIQIDRLGRPVLTVGLGC